MRPRSKDRGSQNEYADKTDEELGFNEAAIKGSRKFGETDVSKLGVAELQ